MTEKEGSGNGNRKGEPARIGRLPSGPVPWHGMRDGTPERVIRC